MSHDQALAGFEHKKFLLQLSDKLTQDESNKIVYLEDLPKQLVDKSPWEVFAHLEMLGKTSSTEELTRILKAIKKFDIAKKLKEAKPRRKPLTRKDSGSSALKLEESLTLAIKNCEILREQLEYLQIGASKVGKKRMEEVVSEAKANLNGQVHRKLKYISGLLASESQDIEQCTYPTVNSSPPSSPENSLTSLRSPDSPPSPVRAAINESELRRVQENLKSSKQRGVPSSMMYQSTSGDVIPEPRPPATKQQVTHNQIVGSTATQPVDTCEEENIYTLPGTVVTSSVSKVDDRMYYNVAPSPRLNFIPASSSASSDKQSSEVTSLVTGSSKANKKTAPIPPPKPNKSLIKQQTGLVERLNESTPLSEDYSSTLTSTGDSGFSDSREFRKDPPPPVMTQKVPAQHELLTDPDSEYAALIKSDVQPPGYYKSTTKRENIPDVVYKDTSDL